VKPTKILKSMRSRTTDDILVEDYGTEHRQLLPIGRDEIRAFREKLPESMKKLD
jgi:hypothetical protein